MLFPDHDIPEMSLLLLKAPQPNVYIGTSKPLVHRDPVSPLPLSTQLVFNLKHGRRRRHVPAEAF